MRIILISVGLLVALAAGYILAWPVRIEPEVVTVLPNAGFTGAFAPNESLRQVRWLGNQIGPGPEDVTVRDGYAFTGLEDGRIIRMRIDSAGTPVPLPPMPGVPAPPAAGQGVETIVNTGGRPLGLQHDPYGNIVVADARKGLLAITPTGQIVVVADRYQNRPLRFVDDLDIGKDGKIFFTDASQRFGIDEYTLDFLEGKPTGRLFSFDPRSGELKELVKDLAFANGVALGPDEDYVLINETGQHRIVRYWLKGPKAGMLDRFIENLPGYPDNISFNGRDLFWVALAGPRNKALDDSLASPFMRKISYRLQMLGLLPQPVPENYGCVIAIDLNGKVVATLQDPGGRSIHTITSVNESNGTLFLGSLQTQAIGMIPVPPQLLAPR